MAKPGFTVGPAEMGVAPSLKALPDENRLEMPRQGVHAPKSKDRGRMAPVRLVGTLLARILLFGGTAAVTAYGVREMYAVMSTGDITLLQWLFLILFALNFAWVSFAACQAVLGFLLILKRDILGRRHIHENPPGIKTAVLAPVYNEDPARVAAAIEAMAEGLAKEAPGQFCFFILSDSNKPRAWLKEEHVFHQLIARAPAECPVYYRHRAHNTERKAGNISDWVTRWGGAYDAMLILDADSIMSAETMVEMARRMEADEGLGLLQTLPSIVLAESLYARLQQFANRGYGLIFGNGLSGWHGNGSNFWGHNAIIRTKAFASAAHLPILKGKAPFGGHVISHDFIEAALLRRAGWGVRFDTDLQHTYEEAPPSVSDVITRDRRWCQGNLQHIKFLFARGLAVTTRLHILSGIMAYMSALFWFLLLAVGLTLAVQASFTRPEYFARPSLFPTWPVFDSVRAVELFILSMGIVLAPKALAWVSAIVNPMRCLRYGGPILVTLSVLTEVLLSALYAPVMMLAQSRIVWEVITGGDSGWQPQRRGDGSISFATALKAHRWHTVIGVVAAIVTFYLHKDLFLWMLPVTGGLMLAAPLSWVSGRSDVGLALRKIGLLRTPEEKRKPPILEAVTARLDGEHLRTAKSPLGALAAEDDFRAWHRAQLMEQEADGEFDPDLILAEAKLERAKTVAELEEWLNDREEMALLNSPVLVDAVPEWVKTHNR
ncbi:glucans biosynthesis glucosyltransferase MdoH [Kordiimonas aestuarii]|uniref:glucans biosynthesis glucosyltransferase MdoH n=1 Tax=Kordiimonas aestuarii TaxID=1005925 RepID=UPI0021CE35CA|nr:glucans biosynthesis glucosyltransferase MdoH [Kordiimonas aestuarii]